MGLAPPEGDFALEATVRDARGGEARAVVKVRVPGEGRAPVAVARARGDIRPGGRVLLDGGDSYDLEGKPLEFHWDVAGMTLVRLGARARPVASFRAPAAGTYEFQLVVSAGGRDSSPARVAVEVPEPAAAEEGGIVLAPVPARVTAGRPVILDASRTLHGSARPRIAWTQTAGPPVIRPPAQLSVSAPVTSPRLVLWPKEPGRYRFRVEADVPGFAPREVGFEVVTSNARPVASARATPGRGGRVVLDGSRSRDPEGAPLLYRWTEVGPGALGLDPALGRDPRLVLKDAPPGRHAVRLVVTDGERVARSGVVEFLVAGGPEDGERRP